MAIRSRTGIDGRLAELETRRDAVCRQTADRFWQRCDELLGRDRVTALLDGLRDDAPWPAEIAAVIDADPECIRLNATMIRLSQWRDAVEKLTSKGRSASTD